MLIFLIDRSAMSRDATSTPHQSHSLLKDFLEVTTLQPTQLAQPATTDLTPARTAVQGPTSLSVRYLPTTYSPARVVLQPPAERLPSLSQLQTSKQPVHQ